MHKMWDEKTETMSRDELHSLQTDRLKDMAERIYEHVPFYQAAFKEKGLEPGDIKDIDDLADLPFTTKADLRDHYPKQLFAVPDDEVVRIHASSGTTGKPTVVGYTQNDIDLWADVMARSLVSAGATKRSVVQNALGYGLFTGGLGFHYGAERLGAQVIPISGGNTEKQIMIMQDFNCDILVATPSYAMHLAEVLEEKGYSPEDIRLNSLRLERNLGPRKCAMPSKRSSASKPSTASACPRSSAPALPWNAWNKPGCIYGKTILCRKSSILKRAN